VTLTYCLICNSFDIILSILLNTFRVLLSDIGTTGDTIESVSNVFLIGNQFRVILRIFSPEILFK